MHSHLKADNQKISDLVRDYFKELHDKYRGIFEKYVYPFSFVSCFLRAQLLCRWTKVSSLSEDELRQCASAWYHVPYNFSEVLATANTMKKKTLKKEEEDGEVESDVETDVVVKKRDAITKKDLADELSRIEIDEEKVMSLGKIAGENSIFDEHHISIFLLKHTRTILTKIDVEFRVDCI